MLVADFFGGDMLSGFLKYRNDGQDSNIVLDIAISLCAMAAKKV